MEVPTLAIVCHEGRPPADDIFARSGCPQPVPARSPGPDPGSAEETRAAPPAGRAAGRRDRGGDRGVEVVRRDRAVGRRCRRGRAGRAGHVPGENRADDDIWRVQRDASHHGGDLAAAQRTETVSQRQLDELDPALRVLRLEGVDDLEQARRPSGGVHHADAQRAFQLQAGGRGTPECIPKGVTGRLELPEQALASLGQSRRNRRAANGPGHRGGQSSGPA